MHTSPLTFEPITRMCSHHLLPGLHATRRGSCIASYPTFSALPRKGRLLRRSRRLLYMYGRTRNAAVFVSCTSSYLAGW